MFKVVVTSYDDPHKQKVRTRKARGWTLDAVRKKAARFNLDKEVLRSCNYFRLSPKGWVKIR